MTKEEATAKLLKRLPKKYHDRVDCLDTEEGLIDDCKFILKYAEGYTDGEIAGGTYPVKSISEAVRFVKTSLWKAPNQDGDGKFPDDNERAPNATEQRESANGGIVIGDSDCKSVK